MGASKAALFSERHNKLAVLAKAMAHPARIAILELIIKKGSCVCGDIVDELPLSQSTVSQHLKELKKAGIIQGRIEGPFRCYCLDNSQCQVFVNMFSKLMSNIKNCC